MKLAELLQLVGDEPLFESSVLLSGDVDVQGMRQQLSRWTKRGELVQLRRGLYALAAPYRKTDLHPFVVANALVRPSYVSLQSALRHYDMIPEHVPVTTSVTTKRPQDRSTPVGDFTHRHIAEEFFWGYEAVDVGDGQSAWIAAPEKALLDLVHLVPGGEEPDHLESLRLQNLEQLDLDALDRAAERWDRPKQRRAASNIRALIESEEEYVSL